MHSASDKHSLAFARYALSAAIICAPPLSVRYDRPVIDAQVPPADPAAGRKRRRRMSSVTLPQSSAGAALFGRAVLGGLDVPRLVPPSGTFPGRLRVLMSTMRQWENCLGEWLFFCGLECASCGDLSPLMGASGLRVLLPQNGSFRVPGFPPPHGPIAPTTSARQDAPGSQDTPGSQDA